MGSLKNQKDKVVGNAKEKIGEMLNKENLIDEGRTQSETPLPESDHISDEQKIEEQRMKHYTGIEEKL